jgi:hypothetical protein
MLTHQSILIYASENSDDAFIHTYTCNHAFIHVLLHTETFLLFRVGLEFPSVEVRFQNLSIEAECEVVHGKPIPTIWNTLNHVIVVSIFFVYLFFYVFHFMTKLNKKL